MKRQPKTITADKHGRIVPKAAHKDLPMRRFIESVDPDALEFILASQDDKYQQFLLALYNPSNADRSFASIAKLHGVTLHELQRIYNDGMRQYGLIQMSNYAPRVMTDVSEDALSKMVNCPRCDGYGEVAGLVPDINRDCPVCKGQKEVRAPGDPEARRLWFEAMRLTGKGVMVAIQQNFGTHNELEDELQLTQKIVMGERS